MVNNEITVIFCDGTKVILKSDAPDLGALTEEIIKHKKDLEINNIKVECNFEGFDEASFRDILEKSISSFLQAIQIDQNDYQKALESCKNKNEQIYFD